MFARNFYAGLELSLVHRGGTPTSDSYSQKFQKMKVALTDELLTAVEKCSAWRPKSAALG